MATQAAGSKKKDTEMDDIGNGFDKGEAGSTGKGSSTSGTSGAGATLDNAKEAGTNLLSDAKAALADKASTAVEDKKAVFTGGLNSVAEGIRQFSGSLNQAEPNPLTEYSAKYVETAAIKVEDVARYLETADLQTVSRDVESFARRNPAVFVGGAFALGIILARFMKSSSSRGDMRSSGQGTAGRRSSSRASKGSTGSTGTRAAA
jgi:hypothetical protein